MSSPFRSAGGGVWPALFALPLIPICALFLVFPISPTVDALGHIAVTMVPAGYGATCYTPHFGTTYRTFDKAMHLAQLVVGPNFSALSSIAMFLMFGVFLLSSVVYMRARHSGDGRFALLLAGPAFLMMHSLMFVWGVFPFILGGWLAVLATILMLKVDCLLAAGDRPRGWLTAAVIVTALSAYAHPIAFVYLGLGQGILWARLVVINRINWRSRAIVLSSASAILLSIALVSTVLLARPVDTSLVVGVPNLAKRWHYLFEAYDLTRLMAAAYDPAWYVDLMALLPWVCLAGAVASSIYRWRRGTLSPFPVVVGLMLAGVCTMSMLAPDRFDGLSDLPLRHMTIAHMLSLMVLTEIGSGRTRLGALLLPAFVGSLLAATLLFQPYLEAQQFQTVVDVDRTKLRRAVEDFRREGGIEGPILVKYVPSTLGISWQMRVTPFLLMSDEALVRDGVCIQNEWDVPVFSPRAIELNTAYLQYMQAPTVVWDTSVFPWIGLDGSVSTRGWTVTFPAKPASPVEPIVSWGITGAADFVYVKYLPNGQMVLAFDHWGLPETTSSPLPMIAGRPYSIQLRTIGQSVQMLVDRQVVLTTNVTLYPYQPGELTLGENRTANGAVAKAFSGKIAPN